MPTSNKKQQKTKQQKTELGQKNKPKPKQKKNKKKVNNKTQKGGSEGKCSNKGPKMIKSDRPPYAMFQTGNKYPGVDKNATDWSNTMNMSTLYPGLPPKPPLEDCVIM